MRFLDIIRKLNMDQRIMVGDIHNSAPIGDKNRFRKSNIMKVGNIPWDRLRHWEYKLVFTIKPCVDDHGKPFLYIGIDDREKGFYDGKEFITEGE